MILAQCNTVENHQDFKSILSRRVIKLAQNNSKTNDSLLLKDRRHEMHVLASQGNIPLWPKYHSN